MPLEVMTILGTVIVAALAIRTHFYFRALQQSEQRNRRLVSCAPYCIHEIDADGRLCSMNSAGLRMMEVGSEEEITGVAYLDVVCEQDRPRIRRLLDDAYSGRSSEFVFEAVNGCHVQSTFVPVHDTKGRVSNIMGITIDITERVHLEEQLRQTMKMEAVGRLAGGIAHDLNNILVVLMGYGEALRASLGPGLNSEQRVYLDEIQRSNTRAAKMIKQLLAFSRKQVLKPVYLDPNESLRSLQPMVSRLIPEHIAIAFDLCHLDGRVFVDPTQLDQVVLNLILNARDAMPGGGQLRVSSSVEEGFVVVRVSDTGPGIDRATLCQIFDPFFTTKKGGTGLGLASSYGIVTQSGGSIEVRSEVGSGTEFEVRFPLIDADSAVSSEVAEPVEHPRSEPATILVTEDNREVRHVACSMLRDGGHQVLEAATPEDALAVLERESVDLLITDVIMPGMNGPELVECARKRSPGLRVLYISGYTADMIDGVEATRPHGGFLEKPFTGDELDRAVAALLVTSHVGC